MAQSNNQNRKEKLTFLLLSAKETRQHVKPFAVKFVFVSNHRVMTIRTDTRVATNVGHRESLMQAHAVVLGLPAKVCAGRAANRVGHEGGVQGASAPRVVHMMHRQFVKAGPPTRTEGFVSVMVCLLYVTTAC